MKEYVDNKQFLRYLIEYRRTGSKKIYEKIGKIILEICRNFMNKPNFRNYSIDRQDEMIGDALFYMIRSVDTFDIELSNPFSYFTQIAKNAFIQNITKYKDLSERFVSLDFNENVEYLEDNHIKINLK
jgi:DNA-directed RNA polymerase specialized sigma24 family protein